MIAKLNMTNKIKLGQLIYTSCRKGLGNGAGLQTQAISPGVSPEQRQEAESLSGYEPPDIPVNPTDEQLKHLCPIEFRYSIFPSGRSALSRLAYVGADYSGRHGNYIAHSLLVPRGNLDSHPIDWMAFPYWIDSVSDDPPVLRDVDLDDLKPVHTFSQLSKFIQSQTEFVEQLPALLHAVIRSRQENRPVVIVDEAKNAPLWVATLTKLFPRNVEPAIEFSTFSNALSSAFDIQCTTESSDFDLSETVFQRQGFVFDFRSHRYSSLRQEENRYAIGASTALIHEPENLGAFMEFVAQSGNTIPRDKLAPLLDCYQAIYLGNSSLTPSVVCTAVQLAAARMDDQKEMIERLSQGIDAASNILSSADRVSIAQSLAEQAEKLTDQSRQSLSETLQRILWMDLHTTSGMWSTIDASIDAVHGGPPASFSPDQVSTLVGLFSNAVHAGSGKQFLTFIHDRLDRCGVAEPWLHENVSQIIAGSVSQAGFDKVTAVFLDCLEGADASVVAEICVALTHERFPADSAAQIAGFLCSLLDRSSVKMRSAIRSQLSIRQAVHILLAESDYRRRSAGSHVEEFLNYVEELDESVGSELSTEIGDRLGWVWKDSPEDEKTAIAIWLLGNTSRFERFGAAIGEDVLTHLDSYVSLTPTDRKKRELADGLDNLSTTLGQKLPPLARTRKFFREIGTLDSLAEVANAWEQIDVELDDQHYALMASNLVKTLIPKSHSAGQHWTTLKWCQQVCDHPSVFAAYKSYIGSHTMLKLPEPAAVAFALAAIGCDRDQAPSDSLSNLAETELDGWLKNLSAPLFQAVCDNVSSKLTNERDRIDPWKQRCRAIEDSRGKLLPWLKRVLGLATR